MKTSILVVAVFLAESCRAQTFVYSTYANGSVSAYIIVSNGSSIAPVTSSDGSTISSSSTTNYPMSTTMSATTSSSIMLPTVPYTGQALLTGSCSIPKYTGIVLEKGQIFQVPLIGCSDDRPECCPSINLSEEDEGPSSTESSDGTTTAPASPSLTPTGVISVLSNHPLSICPSDMVDDDPVCCPSGFTKWATPLLGNIACASELKSSSIPPPSDYLASIAAPSTVTVTGASTGGVVSPTVQTVVETILFALGLPCQDEEEEEGEEDEHHGLSTGAKAGIGVGAALGALAIIALAFFIFKRRKDKKTPEPESVIAQTTDYPIKMPPPAPSSGGWSPSSASAAQDPTFAGYGQGFVDGVKAMMIPPQGQMPPQSPPPPFYATPEQQQYQQRMSYQPSIQQQPPPPQVPVEVPGHYGPYSRWSAQDQAAELSGTNSTVARSEMGYNPSSSGRN